MRGRKIKNAMEVEWDGFNEKERQEKEAIQVLSLTSKRYSLKNLSSTTNKDTRPELYLIVVAYSP